MSVKTELWAAFNEEHVDIKRQGVSDWSDPVEIAVPGDPWAPSAPGLSAASADQAIDLTLAKPATNEDGSTCTDFKEFEVFYSSSSGIDVDDPATYDGSFVTAATQHTFPATETTYFRAVAWDKHGNRSSPSDEVSATPTTTAYTPAVDDYTSNIANVYVGAGIIGIEFQPPKSTWQGWAGYKLYYDYDDGTGWTGAWTHIYTGFGPGFLHKGLNEAYAYKYKCTVIAEDGTETAGTVSDNSGNGYTPNASDNSALLSSTVMAERMIATKEMVSRTFVGGVLQSTNWSGSAGTQFDLDNGTFKLGGSDSPKLSWDGSTLSIEGNVTITGGSGVANLSDAGALATLDVVGTAQIEDLAVTNAKIRDLSFSKLTAGTNTASLVIGSGGYIKSENYSAGSDGFIIYGSGDAEFNDVTVRGAIITGSGSQLNADYIETGTITAINFRTAASGRRLRIDTFGSYSHWLMIEEDGDIFAVLRSTSSSSYLGLTNPSTGGSPKIQLEVTTSEAHLWFQGSSRFGGADSINPVDLEYCKATDTCSLFRYSYVEKFDSNAPTSWTDLTLTSERALCLLLIRNKTASVNNYIFRPNGFSDEQHIYVDQYPGVFSTRIHASGENYCWVLTDANGVVEWKAEKSGSTEVYLLGYIPAKSL